MAPQTQRLATIAVVDVPANSGGGLTILRDLHNWAVSHDEYKWIFLVSAPNLAEHPHIRVVNLPWVKRSWLHRIFFDTAQSWRIIRNAGADVILSLQNTTVPWADLPQLVYVHQPLPFAPRRYALTRSPRMWAYQNLVGGLIRRSIRVAEIVVVQSSWMKKSIDTMLPNESHKILVIPPELNISNDELETGRPARTVFIYPASSAPYKNHTTLVGAARLLQEQEISDFEIQLTVTGEELAKAVRSSPIPNTVKVLGQIPFELVQKKYQSCTLVFPSTLETFGLPLLEARMHGTNIIAADEPYSREVLEGYDNCTFFPSENASKLAAAMAQVISEGASRVSQPRTHSKLENKDPWHKIVSALVDLTAETASKTATNKDARNGGS